MMVTLVDNSALVGDSLGKIQIVDLSSGLTTTLFEGSIGWSDIALNSSGNLYGVSSNSIYLIDTDLGTSTLVTSLPFATNVNALTFGSDGDLYALDSNATLSRIDITSLTVTQVTTTAGSSTDADLVFVQGQLLSVDDGSLVRINETTGATTTLATLDRSDVTGLSVSDSGQLVGYSGDDIFTIDTGTGVTTSLFVDVATLSLVSGATSDNDFSTANLVGSGESDTVAGTDNADVISGAGGGDVITAGAGADVIYGNIGADVIYGNIGADIAFGGQDPDTVFGGQGDDFVYGNFGADILYGNFGIDYMFGGRDDDIMFGGLGDDILRGNLGNDTLAGNLGSDYYFGGSGEDRFDLNGFDIVWDFSFTENDTLYNVTVNYSAASGIDIDLNVAYTDYTFDNGNTVRLIGVDDSFDISAHFEF